MENRLDDSQATVQLGQTGQINFGDTLIFSPDNMVEANPEARVIKAPPPLPTAEQDLIDGEDLKQFDEKYRKAQEEAKEKGLKEEGIEIARFIKKKIDFVPIKPKETRLCITRLFKSDYTGVTRPLVTFQGGCSYNGEWDKTKKKR